MCRPRAPRLGCVRAYSGGTASDEREKGDAVVLDQSDGRSVGGRNSGPFSELAGSLWKRREPAGFLESLILRGSVHGTLSSNLASPDSRSGAIEQPGVTRYTFWSNRASDLFIPDARPGQTSARLGARAAPIHALSR